MITLSSPTEKKTAKRTAAFRHWHEALKDQVTRAVVAARIERLQMGLYGDVKPVGDGVSELRIDHSPGFRVYFTETLDRCIICCWSVAIKPPRKETSTTPKPRWRR